MVKKFEKAVKKGIKKYFVSSFLNKVFFVYLLITLFSSMALLYILSENLGNIKYEQALNMSDQVLAAVNSFMKDKFDSEKSIFQRFIQNEDKWKMVTDVLAGRADEQEYASQKQDIRQGFSQIAYSIDEQYTGIYVYGFLGGQILPLGNSTDSGDYYYFETLTGGIQGKEDILSELVTSRGNHLNNMFSIFILDTVNEPEDFIEDIGVLGVCFNTRNIRQAYQEFDPFLKGNLYILSHNGKIIYDSKAEYREQEIPFEQLQGKNAQLTLNHNIYNSVYNQHDGYYVINRIPSSEIRQDVNLLKESIFKIMIIVILLSLVLTFCSTRYFSKRLRTIKLTIDQIKEGKLSGFKQEKQIEDEVGYIYKELIEMGAELETHINQEYIYQLRQKEMELYALQAQINPHFLYNTLESIRMNLYVKGEKEASKMIYILSEMFRNIMKKGAALTIREELGYVKSYLELYQFRFGPRMKYEIQVDEAVYSFATIKHILQPVIENALIHGIQDCGTAEAPAKILIKSHQEGEDILFVVEDDGMGIGEHKLTQILEKLASDDVFQESVGIYNVNNRLKIVYGEAYKLQIESKEGAGTKVTVKIKAMQKKELENYVRGLNC